MAKTKSGDALDAISTIAAAYAARPDVSIDDIVTLVARLSDEMAIEGEPRAQATATPSASLAETQPRPALPIEQAVTRDKVYCLCCGKGFKMLKRHLGSEHGLNEDEYRALFGLPEDMPLVAPSYSERKAAYAREVGLGKYSRDEGEDARPPAEADLR